MPKENRRVKITKLLRWQFRIGSHLFYNRCFQLGHLVIRVCIVLIIGVLKKHIGETPQDYRQRTQYRHWALVWQGKSAGAFRFPYGTGKTGILLKGALHAQFGLPWIFSENSAGYIALKMPCCTFPIWCGHSISLISCGACNQIQSAHFSIRSLFPTLCCFINLLLIFLGFLLNKLHQLFSDNS